jgi:hypothetical protein
MVNENVWYALHTFYGGGPVVHKEDKSLYGFSKKREDLFVSPRGKVGASYDYHSKISYT